MLDRIYGDADCQIWQGCIAESQWAGVLRMHDRMQTLVVNTFVGGGFTGPALAKVVYNLPLLLAFHVLKQVLIAARNKGLFVSSRSNLDTMMDNAKAAMPWVDFTGLRDGVRRRNEVAHDENY